MEAKKRFMLFTMVICALSMVMTITPARAGSNSTTLPNGAELAVSVDDPVTCTEFMVPVTEDTIDVDVTGTASVGLGFPATNPPYAAQVPTARIKAAFLL